jgi:hypothetical protein
LGGGFRQGYADAFRRNPRIVNQTRAQPGSAAALAVSAAGRAHRDLLRSLAFLALASGGAALVLGPKRLSPTAYFLGVGLATAIDLVPIDREIMVPRIAPREALTRVTQPDPVTTFLAARTGDFRIYPIEEFRSNRFSTFGIHSVGGYHAAKPRAYQEFMDAFGIETFELFRSPDAQRILKLLNVHYLVTAVDLGGNPAFAWARRVFVDGQPLPIYSIGGGPRAYLVGDVVVEPDRARALAGLADPAFDPAQRAIVDRPVPSLAGTVVGTARITAHELNSLTITCDSSGPALLVLTELNDPGWQATVGGEPAPVITTNAIFRGVRVESGHHEVRFTYRSPGLRPGLALSIASAAVIAGLAGLGAFRSWRGKERQRP